MSLELEVVVELQKRLDELKSKAKAEVMDDYGRSICEDFSELRFSAGYIRGLADAMTIALELEGDLIKGKE